MSEWRPKRFWRDAEVIPQQNGFAVTLDGRPVRTPAKALLVVPTERLARAIAGEWDAQGADVDPLSMPYTRSANAALDKVGPQHAEVAELIAAYGESDLLCYRATAPQCLVDRQAEAWDPVLDWAEDRLEARLRTIPGVIHQPQDPEVLARLSALVHAMDAFTLTAFHDLVGMSGSLVLGFAAVLDHRPAEEIWRLSRVDELWQAEQWGADEEAEKVAAGKQSDYLHAKSFYDLAQRRAD